MDPNNPFYYQNMLYSPNCPPPSSDPQMLPEDQPSPISPPPSFQYNPYMSSAPPLLYPPMYPDFSTQCSIGELGEATAEASKKTKRQQRAAWSIEDDKVLASAYLNTSTDAITGTDQSSLCFWKKVAAYYNEFKIGVANRDDKSCKNRWHVVNGQVSKFVAAYHNATKRKKSGESESDVLLAAHKIYEFDNGKKFNLEHAWYMLKDDPKWMVIGDGSSTKRTKINERGNYSSSSSAGTPSTPSTPSTPTTPGTTSAQTGAPCEGDFTRDVPILVRPIGAKAAKRKAKAKAREMPPVPEGIAETVATEARRFGMITEFMNSQNRIASAMNFRTFSKLASKGELTEHETKLFKALDEELFPKNA